MNKADLRKQIWDLLESEEIARFPFPPHNRIPNFENHRGAAERLADTEVWKRAERLKCNPDAPQLPVRRRALRDGKTIYMAVPRLRDEQPFLRLDPAEIDDIDAATTVSGCSKHGIPVDPEDMAHIDLIVAGSVAVDETGSRVGKGEGYSDLEFGVLREFDHVDASSTIATTVHDCQVVDGIETGRHDVPLDLIVTPTQVIEPESTHRRPEGLYWDDLAGETIAEIPVLDRLQGDA